MRYIITALFASTAIPALAEVPKVVTDIPPVHALVAEVMGDLGSPVLLLERGASEHGFQLRPSQVRDLSEADLVVWIGPELTPWLDRALATTGDSSATLTLLSSEGTFTQAYGAENKDEEHDNGVAEEVEAEGHDHDHAAEEDHNDDHDHQGIDPHVWLDPANAKHWLGLIAEMLSQQDPENAAIYSANAASTAAKIDALDADIAAILAAGKDKPIVLFHDAYGYYASHFGLNVAGTLALGDATSSGAGRLSALRDKMAASEALCIFPEVGHDPAQVKQFADEAGAKIGGNLDPVGTTLEPGRGAYLTLMKGIAETIAECAGR
jgi:zinc transport system substrate-binding protein